MQRKNIVATLVATMTSGCASAQLNYNTLDIAARVDDLYVNQALANLSKTIDNHYAIPSQIDVAAGTVQTSASVTPSISYPLSKTVLTSGTGTITSESLAGSGLTVGASDAWQQSWTISPITDGDNLRNLRALYRYVVVEDAKLEIEYTPADKKASLQQPHCVLCTPKYAINRRLHPEARGWLYWSSDIGSGVPQRLPPEGLQTVHLGHWGNHELFIAADAYYRGYLHDFVLFVMGTTLPSSGPTPAKGGGAGASSKRFELIIPQSIQPQHR
jgi:hypothetical protein